MTGAKIKVFSNREFLEFSELYDEIKDNISVASGLNTEFIGRSIHFFQDIDSTSSKAFELGDLDAPEGTVVIAESQSGGKGRRGRKWHSPKGKNIYTSIILRPPIAPTDAPKLTLVAAVALAETIALFTDLPPVKGVRIKWPNDILLGGKKCAGILTEMKCNELNVNFVVIGIGINVNMDASDIPPDLLSLATSILMETGSDVSRAQLIQNLYSNLENWYKRYLLEGFCPVKERWNSLSGIMGKQVRAASATHVYEEGKAMGINDDGALLLEKADGTVITVTVGDVNILGNL